jgi:4a-hydroxytetrahydrobiopterin dehydratase
VSAAARRRLGEDEIETRLADREGWALQDGKLTRQFVFDDFVAAFAFMTRVAWVAESMNHHPEWFNVYSRVRVQLTTHDAGGISLRDFELAAEMDRLAGEG